MSNINIDHHRVLQTLVQTQLNGTLINATDLTTGYSGHVYAVDVRIGATDRTFAIKLTAPRPTEYQGNAVHQRVYDTRVDNFSAAYTRLKQAGLPVPHLFAFGPPSPMCPFYYQIMALLDGVSIREQLAYNHGPDQEGLHWLAGTVFGQVHHITRSYDGWVDQLRPDSVPWKEAFFTSLIGHFDAICPQNAWLTTHQDDVRRLFVEYAAIWSDPMEFVLSHVDGFQGMAKYNDNAWVFTGLIDIEDYHFTDQRFALAGHELAVEFEGHVVPPTFWSGYQRYSTIDPTYPRLKSLFQLYYLFAWLPLCYDQNWGETEAERQRVIQRFERLIAARCAQAFP